MFDRYYPAVFWSIILIALTYGSWLIVSGREQVTTGQLPAENNGDTDWHEVMIDRPIINEVSADGSVNWTLYMESVISREGGKMELSGPRARYSFESGEKLEITGDIGTYDTEAELLVLSGNVEGRAMDAKLNFSVGEITWDNPSGILSATGGVKVQRDGVEFEGDELILNLAEEFASMDVIGGSSGVVITTPTDLALIPEEQ